MNSGPYQIRFVKRAAVPLADNEKVSPWEDSGGTISRSGDVVTLCGTWRVSAIGNVLGGGLIGMMVVRPFFIKKREQAASAKNFERVVVRKKWSGKVFHLFQSREGGMSEVHAFTLYDEARVPDIEEFLKDLVPEGRFETAS